MVNKMRFKAFSGTLLIGATILLSGCGGGGGRTTGFNPSHVTRGGEAGFTRDALILAARRSTDVRISHDEATRIDAELKTIREQVPAVKDIHTLTEYDLHTVIAQVKPGAAFVSNWQKGTLTTGEAKLDSLLTDFNLTKVEALSGRGDGATFLLTFADPLNIPSLIGRLTAASESWDTLSKNYTAGDGNLIGLLNKDASRVYTFSMGWGDCPAGCISRHTWEVTLNTDGSVAVKESGPSPLAATAAP